MRDNTNAQQSRKRQFISPKFVRAMLAGHSALGLAFAVLIYVVCLTGTVTVFVSELGRWEQPTAPIISQAVSAEVVAAALAGAYERAETENAAHDMFVMGPSRTDPRLAVRYHDHDTGVEGQWFADETGRLVTRAEAVWPEFVSELHTHLHLPRTWGLFLVGLTGVALLSSLISGLLSHARIFKDAFALRWGGSRRLQEADLHNRLGVWALPFHLVVSLSGALLGLSVLIMGVLAMAAYEGDSEKAFAAVLGPRAGSDETAAPLPDVAQMIRYVRREQPDAEFAAAFLRHVGAAGQVVHLRMRSPGHLAFGTTYYFKGDGTPIGDGGNERGSVGQQIVGVLQPLHFGWFGGPLVKVMYGLLGVALTIITYNGVLIWLARRRDKGRPAPGWERIWAAVGWGQPVALAASAMAALSIGAGMVLPVYFAALALTFGAAVVVTSAEVLVRILRLASGATLLGAVFVQLVTRSNLPSDSISDPMALYVNLALVICAVVIATPAFRGGAGHDVCKPENRTEPGAAGSGQNVLR